MIQISGRNANELFINTARELLKRGKTSSPRGLKTLELEDTWLTLTNSEEPIVSLKSRNLDLKYLSGEMNWYISGNLDASEIAKYSTFWSKLADTNGTVNSNYGFLALKEKFAGKSQFEWCVERLKEDPDTRQAIINYNQPRHKYPGNKDFVCTLNQAFRKEDDKLTSRVFMRSNDLIYGLTYDLPWFTYLQGRVAAEVGLKAGTYHHYAASLHVYEKHFKMLEEIASDSP